MASRDIKDLHKDFQPMVQKLLELGSAAIAHTGYLFFITDGYRPMSEQAQLYAQGRTVEGKIVTMAAPGQSPHNYGLAVDLAFQKDKKLYYGPELYAVVYPIARQLGFSLGVDWERFKDAPHFEYPDWDKKIKQEQSAPVMVLHKAQRSVTIIVERGANVRSAPNTKSLVVTSLPYNKSVKVVGFVEGETIDTSNMWWQLEDGNFLWAATTNVIPTIPLEQARSEMPVVSPVSPVENAQQVAQLNEQINTLTKLLEEKQLAITQLSEAASQVIGLKSSNSILSDQIVVYKDKLAAVKKDLSNAYVQAFAQWELHQLPATPSRYSLLIPMLLKVIGLFFSDPKVTHVIGWKRNAKIVTQLT